MLKVSLDEGFVFDVIAIAYLKSEFAETGEKRVVSEDMADALIDEVTKQLGVTKVKKILLSNEFQELSSANKATFELIDKARGSKGGLAKKVDDANMRRYNAKVALQKKFFGTEPTEVKTQV